MLQASKKIKITTISIVVSLIIGSCLVWQFLNSKITGAVVEQRTQPILKSEFSLELNSWRFGNASGGMVGSPFTNFRWWREYFLEGESDLESLDSLSIELGGRKHTSGFLFLPSGSTPEIMPHISSTRLAPWWQPETNKEPMFIYAGMTSGRWIVHIYAFKKATNALLYVHIIEN